MKAFWDGLAAATVLFAGQAALAETALERGTYLVETIMGCGNCHTPLGPDGFIMEQAQGGRLVEKNDGFTAIAPNITPAGAVAGWSDADLARAIREGIRPDGSLIGPPMPFETYRDISDEDLAAIVAYIRALPPVENDPGASVYNIPLPPAWGPPLESVSAPAPGVTVEYGDYLSKLGHCMACHSPHGTNADPAADGFARGGIEFQTPWGTAVSPNLTNHPDGLAGYSDDQIKAMITTGTRPDGARMLPPMPYGYLAGMTGEDLDALVMYLRSLPGQPDL